MSLDRSVRPVGGHSPESTDPSVRPSTLERDEAAGTCPVDRVLRVMQSLWSAKIVWWLMHGALRFGDLRRSLGSISAKVLTDRLRRLEEQGVVERRVHRSTPPQMEYSLTPFGRELIPIVEAMAAVAERISGGTCRKRPEVSAAKRTGVRAHGRSAR